MIFCDKCAHIFFIFETQKLCFLDFCNTLPTKKPFQFLRKVNGAVWCLGQKRRGSNKFIFKLERRSSTDLSLIAPHIKALIKGSVSRLLWLDEIFQDSAPPNICRWRDLLYVAALRLLASLVFHLGHRALPASPVSQLSQNCVSVATLQGAS